jgi:prolyl-tRNA editing enzyme YbaK/EbsC (Cys-tRNA(Pro) deacylase)
MQLAFVPLPSRPELVAQPLQVRLRAGDFHSGVLVAAIPPEQADTASFCESYRVPLSLGANCIIVQAKRADKIWYAACLIAADDMIDVNGKVRRHLDARKLSFAPREDALRVTGMEYGGITPLGLPDGLPILMDERIARNNAVVIGAGVRSAKLLVDTWVLQSLPQTTVIAIAK